LERSKDIVTDPNPAALHIRDQETGTKLTLYQSATGIEVDCALEEE